MVQSCAMRDEEVECVSLNGRGANRKDALAGIAGGGAGRFRGALRRRACSRVSGCPADGAARRCERLREAGHRQRSSARGRARSLSPGEATWPGPTAPSTKRAKRRRRSWPGTSTTLLSTRVNAHFDETHRARQRGGARRCQTAFRAECRRCRVEGSLPRSRPPHRRRAGPLGNLAWRWPHLGHGPACPGPDGRSSPMRWPSCATTSSTTPRSSSPKRGPTAAAFLPMIQVEPLSCPPVSLGRKG